MLRIVEKLMAAPAALMQKVLLLAAVGVAVGIVGITTHMGAEDRVFLVLSLSLMACCIGKAVMLGRIIIKQRYIVIEGRCIQTAPLPFSRIVQITLQDDAGEHVLQLDKRLKVKSGTRYTLYFAVLPQIQIGVTYFDGMLSTGNLLALEAKTQ